MKRAPWASAASLLALLAAGGPARGQVGAATPDPPDCAAAASQRPPDPRCGERLDGRPAADSDRRTEVARGVLYPPRLLSALVFWPLLRAGDLIESHDLPEWYRALLTSDDGLLGVRVEIQYATSFLPTAGAHVFYRRLPGQGSELGARFITAGPSAIHTEAWLHAPAPSGFSARVGWERRRDWLFAGIGSATSEQLTASGRGEARYGAQGPELTLAASRPLRSWLVGGLTADLYVREYQSRQVRGGPPVSAVYPPAEIPGFNRGLRLVRLSPRLLLDLMEQARDGGGLRLSLAAHYAEGFAADPSRHLRFEGDLVGAIGGGDRVLLARLNLATVDGLGSATVPFEELVAPAGAQGIRGLPDGRLRGGSGVVASAEYRWYISNRLDASLFTDLGTVAGSWLEGITEAHWFPSFGVGLRYFGSVVPYWRGVPERGMEVAYAPGSGLRILFALAGF
jgi:hypothetical protein